MGLLAWSQLRHRTARVITLLVGLMLATSAFTVLTAAAKTSQLRTVGVVTAHFVPAYDILVRPKGARTSLERRTHSVQPNFLSGIYGGITRAQDRQIASIPGVQVAAPIAMVGYALLTTSTLIPIPAADYDKPGRQLYRINTTWVSEAGSSRVKQPASFYYVTPNRLRFDAQSSTTEVSELTAHHKAAPACLFHNAIPHDPFGPAAQSSTGCWSKVDGSPPLSSPSPSSHASVGITWALPVLVAAVDPVAEAKLDRLNHAVITGRYLSANAKDRLVPGHTETFPVLASSSIGMDEYAQTTLQLLSSPSATPRMTLSWSARQARAPGTTIVRSRSTAAQAYQRLLAQMHDKHGLPDDVTAYWSVGPVRYRRTTTGALRARRIRNPRSIWRTPVGELISMDNEDNEYRGITAHSHRSHKYQLGAGSLASPRLVGVFDPSRIPSFDPLADVPLGAYQPTTAVPVGSSSTQALHGGHLLPNENLGGYVSQPANLITTLSALSALQNHAFYSGDLHTTDPISVIRVRVSGVTGPNAVSLDRIKSVAQRIETRTHLEVDIVDGASGVAKTIDLPAGKYGRPALTLSEEWVKKGVAFSILSAVDRNSVTLFVLILAVCVLFVANSASAAVRSRRRELGVLACLGWTRPRMFASVLGELATIGLVAGILGAGAALALAPALGLHASVGRAALAVPVAIGVAILAGLIPAWLAARAEPIASVRPPVLAVRRARHPLGVTSMATLNVLRSPGRALIGAASLAIGVAALTVLAAVSFVFHGVLIGTLLGNAVALQTRGVDYIAAVATVALGVLAVADVIYLNIRERAPELAAIRAFGWRERVLSRLVVTEGTVIGLVGSVAGAAAGLYVAARFAGHLPDRLLVIAVVEVAGGCLVTAVAALLPARALRRLPAAHLLAEE